MSRLAGILILFIVSSTLSYEKKEIDISYLENYNPKVKDKSVPLNKTGNIRIRSYNRKGLIFIDSVYRGTKEIELALDTGKHIIYEQLSNKIVNDTVLYLKRDYSNKLYLGPKRSAVEINIGFGYCRVILDNEKDYSMPILTIRGNLIYKNNWNIGITGGINILDYLNGVSQSDLNDLDYKLNDNENSKDYYSGGFIDLYRVFKKGRLLKFGLGIKAGIGAYYSKHYFDTLTSATFIKRDPEDPYNYKKYQSFEALALARISKRDMFLEFGGPAISSKIGSEKFNFTIDCFASIASRSFSYYDYEIDPIDDKLLYNYSYIRTSNWREDKDDSLSLILHLLGFLTFKF